MLKKNPLAAATAAYADEVAAAPPSINAFQLIDAALKNYCSRLDDVAQQPTYHRLASALQRIDADLAGEREKVKALEAENAALKSHVAELEAGAAKPREPRTSRRSPRTAPLPPAAAGA